MKNRNLIISGAIALVLILAIITAIASTAPGDFRAGSSVLIKKGQTLSQAADLLAEKGIIRSSFLFKAYATILGGTTGVRSGEYLFNTAESSLRIAKRLVNGQEGFPIAKVTVPEGSSSSDIAEIIARALPGFPKADFLLAARQHEGYLFPDTYFWPANVRPDRVIAEMRALFDEKIEGLSSDIEAFGKPLAEVIIMSSIVEREATSSEDRRIIAGILWKRMAEGMALQVDAPFYYLLKKASADLTTDDLKLDSPYNLYVNRGLTPKPIANPGLAAISDTVNPKRTPYWYYLSDKSGRMHYAATLEGHVENKRKYL